MKTHDAGRTFLWWGVVFVVLVAGWWLLGRTYPPAGGTCVPGAVLDGECIKRSFVK